MNKVLFNKVLKQLMKKINKNNCLMITCNANVCFC